jgi:hypothetical protein
MDRLLAVLAIGFGVSLTVGTYVMKVGYRRKSLGLKMAGFLTAPMLFVLIGYAVLMTGVGQRFCGAFGALAFFMIIAGAVLEIAGALIVSAVIAPSQQNPKISR